MVKLNSTFLIAATIIGTLVPSVTGSAWDVIQSPIFAVTSELDALKASIDAFPNTGGSLNQALAISDQLAGVRQSYEVATTKINSTFNALGFPASGDAAGNCPPPVKSTDSLIGVLSAFTAKKDAFAATPGVSLISTQINLLEANVNDFTSIWLFIAPPDYKHVPVTYRAKVSTATSEVVTAYAF